MLTAMRQGAHSKIVKFVVFSFLLFAVARYGPDGCRRFLQRRRPE
jgi:hypothetical protein